eukprot:CAMPEP_0194391976 /NCGR_PEP_ID=MMETSP0174-20130528/118894_1 /TAXON_ID=216777 /ORGANISM="Proboscia alata, Strain PI-D3" /LENGTH=231 /DNA_ID=CAMNT_0039186871 /DNA_START=970 /DNA_END=1665 /DNA_ORIENTATION=+
MTRFSAFIREGHVVAVLKIFVHCRKHIESKIVFNPMKRDFDDVEWVSGDWSQFYLDIKDGDEPIHTKMTEPRDKSVQVNMFCDALHVSCLQSRCSTTGMLSFLNGAPITWYSKCKNTIESSAFRSELVALKIATEMGKGIRYKLRMMGVSIDGPTNCFCDNQIVVINVSKPEYVLNKNHNSIAYHKVRESVAHGTQKVTHESGIINVSDCLNKFLEPLAFRHSNEYILFRQ